MKKGITKKIIALIIVIACAVVAIVFGGIVKSGFVKASNYSRLDFDKYITLGEYKDLEYSFEEAIVSDEDVKSTAMAQVNASSETEQITEGTAANGDTVNISYEGKIDGEAFTGGTASGISITLGDGKMIPGFEEGIVGKTIGSTFDINVTFPEDYHSSEVAGKAAVFTITLNAKEITKTPEYNDEWVANNTDYKTVQEFEDYLRQELQEQADEANKSSARNSLWNQIMESTEVKEYPEKQLAYEKEMAEKNYKQMAESYGMEFEDLKTQFFGDEETYNKEVQEYAESLCKQKLVLNALAAKENIKVSGSEFKTYLNELLENAGISRSEFKEMYDMSIEQYAKENELKSNLVFDKVTDNLMEYGKNTAENAPAETETEDAE